MRTQLLATAFLAASAVALPLEGSLSRSSLSPSKTIPASTVRALATSEPSPSINPILKAVADAPRLTSGEKLYSPAEGKEDPEVAEAGVFEAFEAAYEAIKEFLRKLKPQVKIPGYTHYVG